MNESYITVHGYVVATPVVRTVGEHHVTNFRIGVTPRKLVRTSGQWSDAETQWYSVSAWRALGENVAHSLRKGDPVIVQGRLSARTWVNANHSEVIAHDIEATVVGHDLRRGVTRFAKTAPSHTTAAGEEPRPDGFAETGDRVTAPAAPDIDDLIAGGGGGAEEPSEKAERGDWNPPLHDGAPTWAGVA